MTPEFSKFVEKRFQHGMIIEYPSIPVLFENIPVLDTVDTFVVLHIVSSEDVTPINLGITSKSRNEGFIQIEVYIPKDQGTREGLNIGKYAISLFKRKVLNVASEGTVTFKDGSLVSRGIMRGRQKIEARINYRYDFTD